MRAEARACIEHVDRLTGVVEDLLKVSKAMAQDTNGDGKVDKYGFQVRPDTFQY